VSLRYLSVCSGIEAATVAWHPLGWQPWAFSEIEAFPSAVLKHHYPTVPNLGDMTRFQEWPDAVLDLLVGGTPCQSFSVAGLRQGLADPRGSLLLTYLAIADRYRPRWLVWENVPGVLSADDGRAFGSLLGGLAELGYGFAYRILDAQYVGLAQRRARVFVVGHSRDWRRAAAVLFERASLSGHPAPRREAGQVAPTVPSRRTAGGGLGTDFDCARQSDVIQYGDMSGPLDTDGHTIAVAFAENQRGELVTSDTMGALKVGGGKPGQGYPAVAFDWQSGGDSRGLDPKDTAQLQRCQVPAVAFQESQSGFRETDAHPTLDSHNGSRRHRGVMAGMQVRRLTPRECERLQGFPDDYTLIPYRGKPAADGPRYKALGNSMAVPVMRWIGTRIAMVEGIQASGVDGGR
jgi:DNA (cytosine-5)-methyltransferase 1